MSKSRLNSYSQALENFSHGFVRYVGTAIGFTIAIAFTLMWLITGVLAGFSSKWETSLYVCMNLVTFLMIFLTQRSQNKEILAMQIKLNEIIYVTGKADNKLINIEESSEKVIHEVQDTHRDIANN